MKKDMEQVARRYPKTIPHLTLEQQKELWERAQAGDKRAQDRLFQSCFPFLLQLAAKYNKGRNKGRDKMEDLIQQGSIGLWIAVNKFDPSRGVKLITFASFWIRAYLGRFSLASSFPVHVGTTNTERRAMRAYYKGIECPEKMSQVTGLEVDRCKVLWSLLATPTIPLDVSADGQTTMASTLKSLTPTPVDLVVELQEEQARQKFIQKALRLLDEKEREVIRRRLLSENPETLDELGREFGCSREWIRQIEARAIKKIRDNIRRPAELLVPR